MPRFLSFCRFISHDAVEYLGANGDLTSYNLYAYCSNNPVMYTDPTGCFVFTLDFALSAECFAGIAYDFYFCIDDGSIGFQMTEANVFKEDFGVFMGLLNASAGIKASCVFNADTPSEGINALFVSIGLSPIPFDLNASAGKTKTIWSNTD